MSADKILKRLVAMKRKPQNGWTLDDVSSLCTSLGIRCSMPGGNGAFAILSHPRVDGLLTIPTRKAIKPFYVMLVVQLVESVLAQ